MKTVLKFVFFLIISILIHGCEEKLVKCKPFDEKCAMFIPQNIENNSITFYSNRGDSLVFIYSSANIGIALTFNI